MTLEQIETTLPNGFHDAEIQDLAMDYEHAGLVLKIRVLVGLPDEPYPACERYRSAALAFQNVLFCSAELPNAASAFQHPGCLGFSYERTLPGAIPAELARTLPPGTLCYSLFIRYWLSSIHIATADVRLSSSDAG
jgi:hypothetical protein